MHLPLSIRDRARWLGLFALLLVALLGASLWLSRQGLGTLRLSDYESATCSTGRADGPRLQLLTLTPVRAEQVVQRLCSNPVVGEHYAGVEIRWRSRGFLTARHILEGQYDLFWNREHLLLGMVPDFYDYYRPLLQTPSYGVYWLSRGAPVEMTAAYFEGRTVGLVEDTRSQTFYLQPMNALTGAGIQLRPDQLRHYRDSQSLYRAFAEGEVDLISSPADLARRLNMPHDYTTLIDAEVPSGAWYVKQRLWGSGVECALLDALMALEPLIGGRHSQPVAASCP
ncbi:hypothetical protein [Parahaliea mediterranea]|uniref:hypothetical protein n=1 Tax=Parahaliea mediterranea TaxID=651086 RepID=UPI000E2EF672|nr:hypothetical protein [Parahaliea mediterranea]